MIKWWNSRNLTEMTKKEPKSSEFPLRNIQKYAEMCWNLQESADFAQKSTADRGDGRRAEPGGHGLPLAKHRKSLVFLAFSRVRPPAAAAGRGRALVAGGGRRGWAKMCRNLSKSAEICRNCSNRRICEILLQNWSEIDQKLIKNPPNSIDFH